MGKNVSLDYVCIRACANAITSAGFPPWVAYNELRCLNVLMLVETTNLRALSRSPARRALWRGPSKVCRVAVCQFASPLSYIICFCCEFASFIRELSLPLRVRTMS